MTQLTCKPDSPQRHKPLIQAPTSQRFARVAETVSSPDAQSRYTNKVRHFAHRKRKRNYWVNPDMWEVISCPRPKPLGYLKEAGLIERAQQGDVTARNAVWRNHLRLAMTVVNEFHIPQSLVPDAFQEAAIGLERAIMHFEVRRFLSFSTYAWYWMAHRIRRLVSSQRCLIRIPEHLQKSFTRLCRGRNACRNSSDWFDWYTEWNDYEPKLFERLLRVYLLANEMVPARGLRTHEAPPENHLRDPEQKKLLQVALKKLSKRQGRILKLRFGLDGKGERTLETIGREIGLTRERVRQIQEIALQRLRRRLA